VRDVQLNHVLERFVADEVSSAGKDVSEVQLRHV
jgi:hypothetical protein